MLLIPAFLVLGCSHPHENLWFSPPSHVVKVEKKAQGSEMSAPGSKTKIQFSCVFYFISLLLGDGATPEEGEERKECEEGKGRKGQHIVGELGKRGGSKRRFSLTPALGTGRERSSERESNLPQVTQHVSDREEELGPWEAELLLS